MICRLEAAQEREKPLASLLSKMERGDSEKMKIFLD
jgi:hypothetical protein